MLDHTFHRNDEDSYQLSAISYQTGGKLFTVWISGEVGFERRHKSF
ncbi:MAG: hypothetical protein L0229_30310 [Blastocatellia bacterium]|nr:hypothetical protein [Blastocatellia bacterium]